MKIWRALIVAALLPCVVSCSKPQSVADLKSAITALRQAGVPDVNREDRYRALLGDAQSRFAAAKPALSADAVADVQTALDRAGDVDLIWKDTDGIADGLTPVVEAPLTRLGVVKNDAEFQKRAAGFIPLQESPDDDTAQEAAEKQTERDQARSDLVKEAMDAADPVLAKAEAAP